MNNTHEEKTNTTKHKNEAISRTEQHNCTKRREKTANTKLP